MVAENPRAEPVDLGDKFKSYRIPLFPCEIQVVRSSRRLFGESFAGPLTLSKTPKNEFLFRQKTDSWAFQWTDRFEFLVEVPKNRVSIWAGSEESEEGILNYLLYHMASFFWLKVGIEPLHGSAFFFNNRVSILLGDSGFGKSTLLAYALSQGAKVITDDVVLLDSKMQIHPTWPRIKLYPESSSFVGNSLSCREHSPILHGHQKSIFKLHSEEGIPGPLPVSSVFILNNPFLQPPVLEDSIKIDSLSLSEAHLGLLENTFNTYVQTPERWAHQFRTFENWVQKLTVQRLTYSRRLQILPRVFFEAFMTSRTASSPAL